jgi:hypothetical protein
MLFARKIVSCDGRAGGNLGKEGGLGEKKGGQGLKIFLFDEKNLDFTGEARLIFI